MGDKKIRVSVPLRGMWFEIWDFQKDGLEALEFPSPYGECGLK